MAAGYSKRSLGEKLGIGPGTTVVALGAPPTYAALVAPLPDGASLRTRLTPGSRFIHQFARRRAELESVFPRLAKALADDGALWISWPKKASGVETDLTEDVLREIGLPLGLVDVKVCAVDDVWSGLKFVRRKENRR
ncbi:MAG: DUF3052 domain-containing protein [Gemmatimonadales bacterium]